jgi:small subunit ribosomal protein S1
MEEEEAIEPQQVEQAGAQSGDQHSMEALLRGNYDVRVLHRGQIVEGVIVQVSPSDVLIDVGAKSEGILHIRELERLGPEGLAALHEGQSVLVYVVTPENRNGSPVLSLSRAQAERDWREAERLFESGEIFEGTAIEYNKGGLIVRLGKVRGFVPSSQIVSLKGKRHGPEGEDPLAGLIGTRMQLKIIDIDRRRNRLVLSERAAVREQRKQRTERLLAELQEGDIRKGKVVNIRDYGAFVDLDGADGLLHISELSWHHVSHPSEVVEVGDEIEVYVLKVDRERKRIGLSLKRLKPDSWSLIADRYHVGQLVRGEITRLTKFGAFALILGDDIEGLIHISELSEERISHPREVVLEGDVRTLRILRIDPDRHRIGLSLKRVDSAEYEDVDTDWAHEHDRTESDDARRGSTSGSPDSGEHGPDPPQ